MSSENIAAAVAFIRHVQAHPKIHARYQQLMSQFVNGELDNRTLVSELEDLFQSHQDLLQGFRRFLPTQYNVSPNYKQVPPKKSTDFVTADTGMLSRCIEFSNKLEKRFADKRGVVTDYVETFTDFSKGKLSETEVYVSVAKIFGDGNRDLVDEFESMLGTRDRSKVKRKKEEEKLSTPPEVQNREDELFEVDVRLSQVKTALNSAKDLMEILRDSSIHQSINIDKCFSAVSLSCIRREYKKQEGFAIIKRLREDPNEYLPEVLSKLEFRQMELLMSREKMNERWRASHQKKHKSK